MSKNASKSYFYLAFRIALFASAANFVLISLLFRLHLPIENALQYGFIAAIGVLITTYLIARKLLQRRFERLQTTLENLASKNFEELFDETYTRRDELDDLIIQSNKTSILTEREIQRLNRLENYRKEFIGDVSHELKTPIFAVQGFLETLIDGALEDERVNRDFLRKAMRNVNRLILLTRDLMEISKLETGELRSDMQVLAIYEIIFEIVEHLQYKAQEESVLLQMLEFDSKINVIADRNQLRQILINLIENGIKYNKPGGTVKVGVKTHPKNPAKLVVCVSDTGLGIDEKDIERVTERFYRIDKSRAREKGGTGLGLSIVKHIVEAHNEQLYIESAINKGSTFSFSLQNADRASS